MSNINSPYTDRVLHQRFYREKQKALYQETTDNESDSDTDIETDKPDDNFYELSDDELTESPANLYQLDDYGEDRYHPDKHDNICFDDDDHNSQDSDNTPPLYNQSTVTTAEAVNRLIQFSIKSSFDKKQVINMMKIIKSILPSPNRLPTSFRRILDIYGKTPSFFERFYCNNCWTLIAKNNIQQYCNNTTCCLFNLPLSKRQVTEVVITNIRDKLQSIIRRNLTLLNNGEKYFPSFDISSSERYQTITKGIVHPITLVLHVDGAPLIRSTKSAVWPCFSSIIELPPPVREYKSNILTLALWVSSVKPNVNLFLNDIIQQLIDLSECGTSIFIDEQEFKINVKTQYFICDLPAKSLFMKTIGFNGYFACTSCLSEGVLYNKQVIYPYRKNNYQARNHDEFVTTAKQVEANSAGGGKRSTSITGIKGLSSLLHIFHYPEDIIFDYMHLICINHVPTLIKRFNNILSRDTIARIDSVLQNTRLPHNVNVKFIYSIESIQDWKAKHVRLFILHLALPILVQYLPIQYSSHFAIYCIFVKLLHCPKKLEDIQLADQLIHYYCQTSSKVYDPKIELYSLHAHIHLPEQVRKHGGLAFTSAFCFESMIHYIKKKAFGTKNLGSQIMYWCEVDSIISTKEFHLPIQSLINEIKLDCDIFNSYKNLFINKINELQQDINQIKLYLRFQDAFSTYHSSTYSKRFSCVSYIISYLDNNQQVQYANVIIFYLFKNVQYSFLQKYKQVTVQISDHIDIPEKWKEKLDSLYPICSLSDDVVVIPVNKIISKCISVQFRQYQCITEQRVNYEHD